MTGVWGRGRGCDELGQLAPPAPVEVGGPEVGETHLQGSQPRVPSSVWPCLAPRVPNWQRQEAPPHHRAVCLGRSLICFVPWSSCRCLLVRGLARPAVGHGPQPASPSHTLSPNSGPCLSLLPHPHPRKRRSQSWRSMWMNSWTWRVMIPGLPGSR